MDWIQNEVSDRLDVYYQRCYQPIRLQKIGRCKAILHIGKHKIRFGPCYGDVETFIENILEDIETTLQTSHGTLHYKDGYWTLPDGTRIFVCREMIYALLDLNYEACRSCPSRFRFLRS